MQLSLLKERSQNIDIQIRKHQTRLNNVERKLAGKPDDKELLKEVTGEEKSVVGFFPYPSFIDM